MSTKIYWTIWVSLQSATRTKFTQKNKLISIWMIYIYVQFGWNSIQGIWTPMLLSTCICENQCRKGHTFLLGINEITFMHVPTSSSTQHPITPPPLLSWPGMTTFCTYCYNCNSIYHYGQVTATICSKNMMLLSLLFSIDRHSKHTVDQDQLNEWVTRKNNTSSNDTSNIIVHCLHGHVFRTTRNEWQLQQNDTYGNDI